MEKYFKHLFCFLFFAFGMTHALWGQEVKTFHGVPISDKYIRGPHLIYDCEDGHWACVDEVGYEFCQTVREQNIKEYFRHLSCAPIKKHDRYQECSKVQAQQIHMPLSKEFCLHPEMRIF